MFSQFRHAVESIAPVPRASVDEGASSPSTTTPESKGHTSTPSWGAGAFGNIATLGKLVQRSESPFRPVDVNSTTASSTAENQSPVSTKPRMTLEDRLKMRFVVGEASPGDTPTASARASPSPRLAKRQLSPASTPLPLSPELTPATTNKEDSPDYLSLDDDSSVERTVSPEPANAPALSEPSEEVVTLDENKPLEDMEAGKPETPPETDAVIPTVPGREGEERPYSPVSTTGSIVPSASGYDTADDGARDVESYPPIPYPPLRLEVDGTPAKQPQVLSDSVAKDLQVDDSVDEPSTPGTPLPIPSAETETISPAASPDLDALRERLKLIEQRFADVSSSFKRLQAEKLAADKILQELTPVGSVGNANELREYLQNLNLKSEMAQDEIKRLNGKLTRQEERLEELRDIHHLESKSMSDLIDKLRKQVEDGEIALKTSKDAASKANNASASHKADIDRLNGEVEKAKTIAKEEEEKRTKAISLLKTVRQKLVKTEKERDDAIRDASAGKDKEKEEREKEKAERAKLEEEIQKVNAERESAIKGIKAHFDREVGKLKEKQEKEIAALKAQHEIETATVTSNSSREISTRDSRIAILERSVNSLTSEKNRLFEQSQIRQAEVESSQSHLESLQSQNGELNYQLRDANERIALLTEELAEARREQEGRARAPSASAEEAARVLTLTQTRYENKLIDITKRLQDAEKERNDGEAEWSKKLEEKTRELDRLKQIALSSDKIRADKDEEIAAARREGDKLREEIRAYQEQITGLVRDAEKVTELENAAKEEATTLNARLTALEKALEEAKAREAQLKQTSKTLRDELRKVQSSAALLEKQRNPGVGYYGVARGDNGSEARASRSSLDLPAQTGGSTTTEADVNLEYIRNVILQFLEHENMRPNLVRVLSAVLHFSPQETRRLMAKV